MNQTNCHNPACRKPIARRDAFLRSISLEQVAFCAEACVDMFDRLDKATRSVPLQRRVSVASGRMGR